jgi:restriction system protein
MNTELSQLATQSFVAPFYFIAMCIALFTFIGALLYYSFLSNWLHEKLATLVWFIGAVFILFTSSERFDEIKDFVKDWTVTGMIIGMLISAVALGVVFGLLSRKKRGRAKKTKLKSSSVKVQRPRMVQNRSDDEILSSSLDRLSGAEFERLLALYFRDKGYEVKEVGVGGKDGGVDLVIIDQRGEKTAVQAKCYANHNTVGVQIVRELVGAKRNHDCILSLLITTSDLTEPAKIEAEQFKVDYWHGAVVEQKLKSWGKWQPTNKKIKVQPVKDTVQKEVQRSQAQVAVTNETICTCGAPMVTRKGREGKAFLGCSTFPKCRQTRSV